MDFVVGLARTQTDHDVIWVIVDRLTKLAHFLAVCSTFSLKRLAILYIDEVVKLHGVLVIIVSDRDPLFTSRFWPRLQKLWVLPCTLVLLSIFKSIVSQKGSSRL